WSRVARALAPLSVRVRVCPLPLRAAPFLGVSLALPAAFVLKAVRWASFSTRPRSRVGRLGLQSLTALLHVIQPLARLCGRLRHGLTPWRALRARGFILPRPRAFQIWSERGQEPSAWAASLETSLASRRPVVRRGGDFDSWDLELPGGLLGWVRARMAIEEHGAGRQLLRLRVWPRYSPLALTLTALVVL